MILEYHRPQTIDEALELINPHRGIRMLPLGGGTFLSRDRNQDYGVVDLQNLGLDKLVFDGNVFNVGATVTLDDLVNFQEISPILRKAILLEASHNIRQMATVAGTLVMCKGNSALAIALLALDAGITYEPGKLEEALGEWFLKNEDENIGKLITDIHWSGKVQLALEYVNKTPLDQPILCIGVGKWPSNRYRAVLGINNGVGKPQVVFDGKGKNGIHYAINNACSHIENKILNHLYLQHTAQILLNRCLNSL